MHVPFLATSPFGEGWGEVWDERSGGVFCFNMSSPEIGLQKSKHNSGL